MKDKSAKLILVILAIILLVIVPLCLDWLVIGNSFPSNVEDSDWIGFFGGYFGALIGAFASLGGVMLTIRFTREQSENDARLQVRPYCSFQYYNHAVRKESDQLIGHLAYGCEPKENENTHYSGVLYIKNVGMGPALDFQYSCSEINDSRKHFAVILQSNPEIESKKVNHLLPGEKAAFTFDILFNFDSIAEEDCFEIEREDGSTFPVYSLNPFKKYPSFEFTIRCLYNDIYNTVYYNDLKFYCQISISSNQYIVDVYLRDTSTQQKKCCHPGASDTQ